MTSSVIYLAFVSTSDSEAVENQTQQVLNRTVNYLNVSYTVILKNLTWFEALQECLQNNMQLVSITEQYQQAFLATQATPPDDPLWIGLSSKDVRSSFPFLSKHAIGILKETVAGGDI